MTQDKSRTLRRRDVMRVAGAAAVGGVALSGMVSAHTAECVYFCGCGRMVAYRDEPEEDNGGGEESGDGLPDWYPVLVAKEGGGEGPPELRHYLVEGEHRNLEFTNRGRGKILAFGVDEDTTRVYYNPNECAQNVFEAYADEGSEEDRVLTTVNDYFRGKDVRSDAENNDELDEDDKVKFSPPAHDAEAGEKGHCHPPRDDHHCNHDRGSDSNGQSNSNGRSNGRGNGR